MTAILSHIGVDAMLLLAPLVAIIFDCHSA